MTNEIVLAEEINKRTEKKLMLPSNPRVFPLTPTHRSELRDLKKERIGALQERLNTIKKLKVEEYQKKYAKEIAKEIEKNQFVADELNKDWEQVLSKIRDVLVERKNLEKKKNTQFLSLNTGYRDLAELKIKDLDSSDYKRNWVFNKQERTEEIAKEEFKEKYGTDFTKAREMITKLETQYEEAINFGDLDVVKEIYYRLKKADDFFTKVSKIKV